MTGKFAAACNNIRPNWPPPRIPTLSMAQIKGNRSRRPKKNSFHGPASEKRIQNHSADLQILILYRELPGYISDDFLKYLRNPSHQCEGRQNMYFFNAYLFC